MRKGAGVDRERLMGLSKGKAQELFNSLEVLKQVRWLYHWYPSGPSAWQLRQEDLSVKMD